MTELGLNENIQEFDIFRGLKAEENLFLHFFKITEVWFIPPIPIRHYFWVFMQKISTLGLTQLRLSLMCRRTSAKCFQPKFPISCHGLRKNLGPKKKRFQNQPKLSQGTSTVHNRLFFNQPMPMGGLPQVSRRLLGKI